MKSKYNITSTVKLVRKVTNDPKWTPYVYERKAKGIQKVTNVITGKVTYRARAYSNGQEINRSYDTYRDARGALSLLKLINL